MMGPRRLVVRGIGRLVTIADAPLPQAQTWRKVIAGGRVVAETTMTF